jgi:hypothetical protein
MSAEQRHRFEDVLAQDIATVDAELSPPTDSPAKTRSRDCGIMRVLLSVTHTIDIKKRISVRD